MKGIEKGVEPAVVPMKVNRSRAARAWGLALQLLTAGFIIACVAFVMRPGFDLHSFLEALRDVGPFWFFGGLAILPLVFVPTSPFYILAGAAYPLSVNFIGIGVSIFLNMTLAYFIGFLFLRTFSLRMAEKVMGRPVRASKEDALALALLVKLAPGVSSILKSYIMSAAGIPFLIYTAVSWTITMCFATGMLFFGASLRDNDRGMMIFLGLLFLASIFFFAWYMRRYLKRRNGRISKEST